ncbi:MAG: phospholipase D-like domain-containing protein [Nocardioides sp.]
MSATLVATILSVPAASADDGRNTTPVAEAVGAVAQAQSVKAARAAEKKQWRPNTGPVFNNPYGGDDARFRIERRILEAIRHSGKNDQIKIAIYSWDRIDMAKAVIKARRRGAQVQILLNDHQVTRAQRMMKQAIGRNPSKENFVYECDSSCRGRRDNLHTKFYLFSSPGAATDVIMLGSHNLTLNAVKWQWNDFVVLRNKPRLYDEFQTVFNDMRRDWSKNRPFLEFCGNPAGQSCQRTSSNYFTQVFPVNVKKHGDPAMEILDSTRCAGGTKVRVSMHTMRGSRAERIAERLRAMYARGCNIKVLYGLMGFPVKRKLGAPTARGRIPLRSTGYDYNGDGDVDRYTHQKYVTIKGNWGGRKGVNVVFGGSSNWSNKGLGGDEIVFNMYGAGNVAKYNANWDFMWNNHSRNSYTTTSSEYRTVVPVWKDGVLRPKVVTKTVTRTEVLPDRLGAGSSTFESD